MSSYEIIRLGLLGGDWGTSADSIGLAIGRYAPDIPNMVYDAATGELTFSIYTQPYLGISYNGGNPKIWLGNDENAIEITTAGLSVGSSGHIRGGQTDYATGVGFWCGSDSGTYKFSIGNYSTHQFLDWDGTILTISGSISVSEGGTIGGWYVGANTIESLDSGAGIIMDSSVPSIKLTDGTYDRVFIGKSGTDYGIIIKDENNNVIFQTDDTNKTLAGWTIDDTKIYNSNTYIHSTGYISFGSTPPTSYGNNVGAWLGYDSGAKLSLYSDVNNYLQWNGSNLEWRAGDTSLVGGNLEAKNATISGTITTGNITATGGTIGGWDISSSTLSAGTSNIILDSTNRRITINSSTFASNGIQLDYNSGTPRAYIGNGNDKYLNFDGTNLSWSGASTKLTSSGELHAANAIISGTITANTGYIGGTGGWIISSDKITSAGSNLELDGANEWITIGDITSDGIRITSSSISAYDTGTIKGQWNVDSEFWLGSSSSGKKIHWNPATDTFTIRGNAQFDTLVWQEVLTTKGSIIVAKSGGELYDDTTATGTTFTINVTKPSSGSAPFSDGDVCKIDNGINSTWFTVNTATDNGDYFTYTATYQSGSNSATYREGTAITDYGQSGDGFLEMVADSSGGGDIRYSVKTHSGSPWSIVTEKIRFGNLNNFLDYSTDIYGFAAGSSSSGEANITIDSTNGLRIRQDTTDLFVVDNSGNATMTSVNVRSTSTGARVELLPDANTGIQVVDDVGADVFKAIIGGADVGDVIIGNYSGNQGIFWDKSAGTLSVRGSLNADDITAGTLTGRTVQTASTGQRVVVDGSDNNLKFYDSSGNECVTIDDNVFATGWPGIIMSNSGIGGILYLYKSEAPNEGVTWIKQDEFYMTTTTAPALHLDVSYSSEDVAFKLESSYGNAFLVYDSGQTRILGPSYLYYQREKASDVVDYIGSFALEGVLSDSYTVLLLLSEWEGSSITIKDYSDSAHTVTANGNAQTTTLHSVFGDRSIVFDGAGDYLSVPDSADWYFGSDDFTIDFWVRFNSLPADGSQVCFYSQFADTNNYIKFFISNIGGTYYWNFQQAIDGSVNINLGTNCPSDGLVTATWYHVAIVREGNDFMVFQDGVLQGSVVTDPTAISNLAAAIHIGEYNSGEYFDGWLDNYRISKGIARWTHNFVIPSHGIYSVDESSNIWRSAVFKDVGDNVLESPFTFKQVDARTFRIMDSHNTTLISDAPLSDRTLTFPSYQITSTETNANIVVSDGSIRTINNTTHYDILRFNRWVNDLGDNTLDFISLNSTGISTDRNYVLRFDNRDLVFYNGGSYNGSGGSSGSGKGTCMEIRKADGVVIGYGGFMVGAEDSSKHLDDASNGSSSSTLYIGNRTVDTSASDLRYKNVLGKTKRGLKVLDKLEVIDYIWKDEYESKDKKLHIGIGAQDAYRIDECLARKPEDENIGIWALSHDDLIALLVKSVQELNAENKKLKNEIKKIRNALKNT